MNTHTGHIATTHQRMNKWPAPVGYYDLSAEEIASLPRQARRALQRKGETRLPLNHSLVRKVRAEAIANLRRPTF